MLSYKVLSIKKSPKLERVIAFFFWWGGGHNRHTPYSHFALTVSHVLFLLTVSSLWPTLQLAHLLAGQSASTVISMLAGPTEKTVESDT